MPSTSRLRIVLGLLDHEDEGNAFLRNVGEYSPHTRRREIEHAAENPLHVQLRAARSTYSQGAVTFTCLSSGTLIDRRTVIRIFVIRRAQNGYNCIRQRKGKERVQSLEEAQQVCVCVWTQETTPNSRRSGRNWLGAEGVL